MSSTQQPNRTGGYYHLMKAVLYRELIIWLRYPVDAVLGIMVTIVVFTTLFLGGTAIAGQAFSDSIEGILVGYFLLITSNSAYSGISGAVGAEATWGTLERHYLTPFGFGPVMIAKAIGILLKTFITSSIMLLALVLLTGTHLELPVLTVLAVGTLTISSVFGIGLATGGMGVLYKRIGAINSFIGFAFAGLIAAPVFDIWWAKILPLAQGSALLQLAMTDGVRLWEFEPGALAMLIGVGVGYLAFGYVIFKFATMRARQLGTLGDY